MTVQPTGDDVRSVKASEMDHSVTLTDCQRAYRVATNLQDAYGISQSTWEQIKEKEIARVDQYVNAKNGNMPISTWASKYGQKSVKQFHMLCGLLEHRTDVDAQAVHLDSLAQDEARRSTDTEEEKRAQRSRVVDLYKAKTAVDLLRMMGFTGGVFDNQALNTGQMFTTERKKRVATAVLKWISQLDVPGGDLQHVQKEMQMIMDGNPSKTTAKDMLNKLNSRFFQDALGVALKVSSMSHGKRKRTEMELATQTWQIRCEKFRIQDFSDDGDVTKPRVHIRGPQDVGICGLL